MIYPVKLPRKLIEVALPLDAINVACAREKSIRHGHPSTLHMWWARRPLAAARVVIFAQLVNDPGYQAGGGFRYGKNKKEAAIERKRLFKIMEDLVLWESTNNEEILERARVEIRRSWREVCELNKDHPQAAGLFNPENLPGLHDPFAGGGAIPLEAQRLGLGAFASDLNPVAVLINKAMIDIPAKFGRRNPVGPSVEDRHGKKLAISQEWPGATGLAEDVRRYGTWMRTEAQRRIGHLYPPIEITAEMALARPDLEPLVGKKLVVIAWLWARTVKSPSPAFSHVDVPLAATFVLSVKEGKVAYVQPVVMGDRYHFTVNMGAPPPDAEDGTKVKGRGSNFRCLVSGAAIGGDYIKAEGHAGRIGAKLMAVVVESTRTRVYLAPTPEIEAIAAQAKPSWRPSGDVPARLTGGTCVPYGLRVWGDLFTPRQLVALTTFSDLVGEVRDHVAHDARAAGMSEDARGLDAGGTGAVAYAEAVGVYLALATSRFADRNNALCTWDSGPLGTKSSTGGSARTASLRNLFARQAIPMAWDFGEANPFSDSGGGFNSAFDWIEPAIKGLYASGEGSAVHADAQSQTISLDKFVSTDPPYYDNIGYADLSDFFYVWLRRALKGTFPDLLATIAVPKAEELVAAAYRHGGKPQAEAFFLEGMTRAMRSIAEQAHPGAPITIYYAFKASETKADGGTSSNGWETFLEAVHRSGLQLTGTWPMRTELANKVSGHGNNMLASSIVLVCRKRPGNAVTVSRREFSRELNTALPEALDEMINGSGDDRSPVAPVDLSQAIIGPGMAVFSKYASVLEANGAPMSVHTALQLINRFLAEDDFEPDTQFCLRWFEQVGWKAGKFGDADTLSRAKGTSVEGVKNAGVIQSGSGLVRLLKWSEYPSVWDPKTDVRNPVWETLHHLIRALNQDGELGAGRLLAAVRSQTETTRQLAYRLYTLCERQGWAEDARAYNELIASWSSIESAASTASVEPVQGKLFD